MRDVIIEQPLTCEMLFAAWYYLYNFKNMKITHGGVLLLVKLHALATHTISHIIFRKNLRIFFILLFCMCISIYKNEDCGNLIPSRHLPSQS